MTRLSPARFNMQQRLRDADKAARPFIQTDPLTGKPLDANDPRLLATPTSVPHFHRPSGGAADILCQTHFSETAPYLETRDSWRMCRVQDHARCAVCAWEAIP